MNLIQGYSKLSKDEKLDVLEKVGILDGSDLDIIRSFRHRDLAVDELFEKFTENVVSSYHIPFSIAPNFQINDRTYHVPMVIEESSVVAAASWSAKFWSDKGGFKTKVISETKLGQIHFKWKGPFGVIERNKNKIEKALSEAVRPLSQNMIKRGGGVTGFKWINLEDSIPDLFQCLVSFNTADSMGANFINSCLERMGQELIGILKEIDPSLEEPEIIMAILSNFTPDCLVECTVEAETEVFTQIKGIDNGIKFAEKFLTAVQIAQIDPYRAVTHNKGIFNGMDAVVLATANDFRAFEAGGHAFASRNGQYCSLTSGTLEQNRFSYTLKVPMAVGTIGGLTSTHPLAKIALRILGNPSASELMEIIAAAGMANNFSAVKALITTGIQSGHMKMHLSKILIQLGANIAESSRITQEFKNKTVSFKDVSDFLHELRKSK